MTSAKKMDVPDIGGLLTKITEKRAELPKAPIQTVRPVDSTQESSSGKTSKHTNAKTESRLNQTSTKVGGRPSSKIDGVEYVKLSPRIPKKLKKQAEIALVEERLHDSEKRVLKTMDELVEQAIIQFLASVK